MSQKIRFTLLAGILLTLSLPASLAAKDSVKTVRVRLRTLSLSKPGMIVSPADFRGDEKTPLRIVGNIIVPGHRQSFSQTVTLAGRKYAMFFSEGLTLAGEKNTYHLRAKGSGFRPLKITSADHEKYPMAFPLSESSPTGLTVYYRSGMILQGKIGKTPFSLYDDNLDGKFTLADDCVRIGKSRAFCPLGKLLCTPSGVYEVKRLATDGSDIALKKITSPARRFTITFPTTGIAGHFVMGEYEKMERHPISSISGKSDAKNSAADGVTFSYLTGEPAPYVPPGTYRLRYGLIYHSQQKKITAAVLPGKIEPVQITEKHNVTLQLGKPLRFTFDVEQKGAKFLIDPKTIRLFGVANEEYVGYRFVTQPKVFVENISTRAFRGLKVFERNERGEYLPLNLEVPADARGTAGNNIDAIIKVVVDGFGPVEGRVKLKPLK